MTLPNDAMAQLFQAQPANDLPVDVRYNICPTNDVAVVVSRQSGRQLVKQRWGFIPHWYKTPSDGPLLINARAETIADKPAFAAACRHRRCLIPADGFFEWTKGQDQAKLPWYIFRADDTPMVFAGIWQDWGPDKMATCAIVTTPANSVMQKIHHRLPVILPPSEWGLWLGEQGKGAARLMQACSDDVLSFHRVDPRVNSNKASGAELIEKIM